MSVIKLASFGGMLPAIDEHLLPDTAAAYAENSFLYSGALRPLPKPKLLHTLVNPTFGSVFRIPKNYLDPSYLYDSYWMEFVSPNTDVIRSQVFGDVHDRYYIFSDAGPPVYNTKARIVAGLPPYRLGVPTPVVSPFVVPSGGVEAINHTRAYCYTWVTTFGEEGAPSPSTLVTYRIDGTYTLTLTAPGLSYIAPDGADGQIDRVRIYRSVTSASGVATFFFVTELPIATLVYADTLDDLTVSYNEQLTSLWYTPPPIDLKGVVVMPNGMLVGWVGSDLWFSEPYTPHAWPAKYGQTLEYEVVGLGVTGQTLVVCTSGYPSTASGTHPSFITMSKLTVFEPCLSRGSIISSPEGVYYASPAGLMLISYGSAQNITRSAATRDKWQKLTHLTSLKAARLGTAYYAFGSSRGGVFEEEAFEFEDFDETDLTGSRLGILVDPPTPDVGIVQLTSNAPIIDLITDIWSGEVLIVKNGGVYWLDMVDIEGVTSGLETVLWDSKIFQTYQVRNFGAVKVYFDALLGSPDPNIAPGDGYGRIKVLADGVVCMDRPLKKSGQLMRPASGFKADFWQIKIECRVKLKSVQAANSVRELIDA